MARHTELDVAPSNGEYVDGAQGVHTDAFTLDQDPARQLEHCAEPLSGAYDPAAQATHRPEVALEKEPGAQGAQDAAPLGTVPGMHTHAVAPAASDTAFAPQAVQDVDPAEEEKKFGEQAAGGREGGVREQRDTILDREFNIPRHCTHLCTTQNPHSGL